MPAHVRFKVSETGSSSSSMGTPLARRSHPSGSGGGGLPHIAHTLEDGTRRDYARQKNIAEDFYKVMAVNSVKSLAQDALLGADESPAALHGLILDPSLPERMMALENRGKSAGAELARLPWEAPPPPPPPPAEPGSSGRGVSFALPEPEREPPLPPLDAEDEARRAAALAQPPGSPERVEQEHEAMFSAVRDQVSPNSPWSAHPARSLARSRFSHYQNIITRIVLRSNAECAALTAPVPFAVEISTRLLDIKTDFFRESSLRLL